MRTLMPGYPAVMRLLAGAERNPALAGLFRRPGPPARGLA